MTEITQADRDAAAQVLGEMVLGNEDRAAQVIARHRKTAAAEERAKIVAWLRSADRRLLEAPYWADVIEAGEHVTKGGAE